MKNKDNRAGQGTEELWRQETGKEESGQKVISA